MPDTTDLPVLLVDDQEVLCNMMSLTLCEAGITNVICISDSRQVLPFLREHGAALVLLDLVMPHLSGQELLGLIHTVCPCIQVVVVSGANELHTAVDCMKLGALDYLSKPVEASRLIACVKNALKIRGMQHELMAMKKYLLEDTLEHPDAFAAIKTCSSTMRALFQYSEVIARSSQPILITGETGVGKDLLAQAVHRLSGLNGELVSVNVAGLDDATFADTLFGHKKGAFTGADQAREGLIARASDGTLFLDEIGDLEERSQIKLLRLLQDGDYYPVGSDTPKRSRARIVAATNHTLSERVDQKLFRRDLLCRLSMHTIHIPPLRERPKDIPLLLDHFLEEAALAYGKPRPAVAGDLIFHLSRLSFPGNVRELKAMAYDAVVRHGGGELTASCLNGWLKGAQTGSSAEASTSLPNQLIETIFGHFPTVRETEDYLINEALRRCAGNLNQAAAMLGITRQTIANRRKSDNADCKKQGINRHING